MHEVCYLQITAMRLLSTTHLGHKQPHFSGSRLATRAFFESHINRKVKVVGSSPLILKQSKNQSAVIVRLSSMISYFFLSNLNHILQRQRQGRQERQERQRWLERQVLEQERR